MAEFRSCMKLRMRNQGPLLFASWDIKILTEGKADDMLVTILCQ